MNHLSLFSGIGGIDLAGDWAGMKTIAFCEREPFPQKVLAKHWPGIPIYDDVCTLTKERLENDGIDTRTIGIISAGYPCQPFSVAGKREGKEDDRHLWPEVKRLLEEIRPRWFVGENVAGHVTLGLDTVLSDLADIGYTCQPFIIPSSAVGAPHKRERVFIVAHADSNGDNGTNEHRTDGNRQESIQERKQQPQCGLSDNCKDVVNPTSEGLPEWRQSEWSESEEETGSRMEPKLERPSEDVAYADHEPRLEADQTSSTIGSKRNSWDHASGSSRASTTGTGGRSTQSKLGRSLDGISAGLDEHRWPAGLGSEQYDWEPPRVSTGVKDRVGRLKALGNAVNPHQVFPILAAIKAINDTLKEDKP